MIDAHYVTLILDPSDASRHPRCVERPALCEARKIGPVSILPASQLGEGPRPLCLGFDRSGWRRGRPSLPRPLGLLALHPLLPFDRLPEHLGEDVTGRIQ